MARRKRTAPDYTSGVWEKLRQQHIAEIKRQIGKLEEKKLLGVSKLKNVDVKDLNKLSLQQVNEILNKSDYRKIIHPAFNENQLRKYQSLGRKNIKDVNTDAQDKMGMIMDRLTKQERKELKDEYDSDQIFDIGKYIIHGDSKDEAVDKYLKDNSMKPDEPDKPEEPDPFDADPYGNNPSSFNPF